MANSRQSGGNTGRTRRPPARTIEGRENELIALAVEAAEEKIRNGTASSQMIVHYLKLGSTREKLEQAALQAKIDEVARGQRMEELYSKAIESMKRYGRGMAMDDEEGGALEG